MINHKREELRIAQNLVERLQKEIKEEEDKIKLKDMSIEDIAKILHAQPHDTNECEICWGAPLLRSRYEEKAKKIQNLIPDFSISLYLKIIKI